jgi:hypothetical protein
LDTGVADQEVVSALQAAFIATMRAVKKDKAYTVLNVFWVGVSGSSA